MGRRYSSTLILLALLIACSRDREPTGTGTLTGATGDQSGVTAESDTDRAIGQAIRQSIDEDGDLSPMAKSVTVITSGAVVTLRGKVKTDQEKVAIASKARTARGVSRVDNLLEVESPR